MRHALTAMAHRWLVLQREPKLTQRHSRRDRCVSNRLVDAVGIGYATAALMPGPANVCPNATSFAAACYLAHESFVFSPAPTSAPMVNSSQATRYSWPENDLTIYRSISTAARGRCRRPRAAVLRAEGKVSGLRAPVPQPAHPAGGKCSRATAPRRSRCGPPIRSRTGPSPGRCSDHHRSRPRRVQCR